MSGDHTRFTFDPLKRYSGVLMQQGASSSIPTERRDRHSEAPHPHDDARYSGPLGVPYVVSPNAFSIGWIPGPPTDLSIGPGGLYVDGIQIEAFAEDGATYNNQPFARRSSQDFRCRRFPPPAMPSFILMSGIARSPISKPGSAR